MEGGGEGESGERGTGRKEKVRKLIEKLERVEREGMRRKGVQALSVGKKEMGLSFSRDR